MGESDRSHLNERNKRRRRKNPFTLGMEGNALVALFAVNAIFFIILLFIQVGMYAAEKTPLDFYAQVVSWFEFPAGLKSLSEKPWAIITYMFTDTGSGIIRAISNMIWLWAFGYLLQQMAGNDKLAPVYIYGGIAGAIFFLAAHYLFPPLAAARESAGLLGANAAVLAVATATTTLNPDHRFFTQIRNGIPIWVLLAIYLLIDLAGVANGGAGYALAHVGGALSGFVFILFMKRGYDGSVWMNKFWHWLMNVFTPKEQQPAKEKIFYDTRGKAPFTKTVNITQTRVDALLDKINQKGYHFLTEEEKDFLKNAAKDI